MSPLHPFNEFVVKVASRCNIDCDYCYEYRLGDDSWRRQPKFMDESTVRILGRRIREHAESHKVPLVHVSMHGGEPMLLGADRIDRFCTIVRREIRDACEIQFGMQTNATLATPAICEAIRLHQISVSVSLDGNAAANDRHRRDHRGESTYGRAVEGVRLLRREVADQVSGVLAVLDLLNDPVETFDALAELGLPSIDILLPHFNWDRLPPRPCGDPVAYGRWYWAIYQAWVGDRHPGTRIRFLENIVAQLCGGDPIFEAMSLAPVTLATIATDGSIEAVDCLKSTASGVQQLGMNVHGVSLDVAAGHRLVTLRHAGLDQLCSTCRQCRYRQECAGGYFPHRWAAIGQFDHPSIYCADLMWLIDRIKSDLQERVSDAKQSLSARQA